MWLCAALQATLNARTSILAAANPLNGRYDKTKNMKQNINLPPAILSRYVGCITHPTILCIFCTYICARLEHPCTSAVEP